MRTLAAAAWCLVTALPTYAYQNEPYGFRGIDWDTPLEQVADQFTELSDSKGRGFYQRKGDKLTIGEAELESVTYVFYKGRFQGAMLTTTEGAANQRALRDAFTAQFGRGEQPNRYIDRFYWWGAITQISLNCSSGRKCLALLRSKALSDTERADRKTAAEGAKKDF